MNSGYGIAFHGRTLSFFNGYGRNVAFFGVSNSSSYHDDNRRNNNLVLREGDTFGIDGSFGAPEKSLIITLLQESQNFASVYITMVIIVTCLLMEKKSLSLKSIMEMSNFPT